MMNKIIIAGISLLTLMFIGCSKGVVLYDDEFGAPVELKVNIGSDDPEYETKIDRVRFLIFGSTRSPDSDELLMNKYYSPAPANNVIKEIVTTGLRDVYIIINEPTGADDAELDIYKDIAAVNDIRKLSLAYGGIGASEVYVPSEIPMFVKHIDQRISLNSQNEINGEVDRVMSKVTVNLKVKNSNFPIDGYVVIDNIIIKNLPQVSYLISKSYTDGTLVSSEQQGVKSVTPASGYDFASSNTFYVPEYILHNPDNYAYIEISGHINGDAAGSRKWTVKLGDAMDDAKRYGNRYDLTRNRHYSLDADVKSFGSGDDLSIKITVLPWNTVNIEEETGRFISLDKTTQADIPIFGGTYNVKVTSSVDWAASSPLEGVTFAPAGGGAGTTSVAITVPDGGKARSVPALFTSTLVGVYPIKATWTGSQGALAISVTPATANISSEGGSYTVKVTSNAAWTAKSTVEGVTTTPVSGLRGETRVTIKVPKLPDEARPVPVEFTATFNGETTAATWTGSQWATVMIAGTKWTTVNLTGSAGSTSVRLAASPSDYGMFFKWGDTWVYDHRSSIHDGDWTSDASDASTSPSSSNTGDTGYDYGQGLGGGRASGDPCRALGATYKTPTHAQWFALAKTGSKWGSYQGVNGRFFGPSAASCTSTSIAAGCIFIPAAGYRYYYDGSLRNEGTSSGNYWSSSVYNSAQGYGCLFNSSRVNTSDFLYRGNGLSVRCVME